MIEFQNVGKAYLGQAVLEGVTFRIGEGERVGVVGPNGAGKSTLFGLIAGEIAPDTGAVTLERGLRLGYVRQQLDAGRDGRTLLEHAEQAAGEVAALEREMHDLQERLHAAGDEGRRAATLRALGEVQTRFEQAGGYATRHEAQALLGGLGFEASDFDRPLSAFSGGWQMRAELARCLAGRPRALLLDEPSNYLDIPAVEWLQRFLRDFAGTLVLISHDRYLLNHLTRVTFEVANARVTRYAGPYDRYVTERAGRAEQQRAALRNQERKRRQAERFIERFRSKNTRASQVQSVIKKLERMEEIAAPEAVVSPGRIRLPPPPRTGVEVLRLDDAGYTYDGNTWVLRHVDLRIVRDDRFALVGLNGRGKTTLMRLLAGQLAPREGRRVTGANTRVGYLSQDYAETMDPDWTVEEIVKAAAPETVAQWRRTLLGSFGFSGDAVEKPVRVLSGGEKIRLALARLLARPPNLLLLDEPTTHLDIDAREALEEALCDYGGTLCLVSHDIEFVRAVAGSIIEMRPPGIRIVPGDYDYYRETLPTEAGPDSGPDGGPDSGGTRGVENRRVEDRRARAERIQAYGRRRAPLRRELADLETRIAALETEQGDLVARLNAGTELDYAATNRRLTAIHEELAALTERWSVCGTELETIERELRDETTRATTRATTRD